MSKVLNLLGAVVVAMYMSVAMADSAADAYAQCKQDAANSEVSSEDMSAFIHKCMEDSGVDAGDIDKAMKGSSD